MNNPIINTPLLQGGAWNTYSGTPSLQTNIAKVNGIESVKASISTPQSRHVYFDAEKDIFYIKETDINNYPTIRIFRYEEIESINAPESVKYVTVEEFNRFKEAILNGQHISNGAASTPASAAAGYNATTEVIRAGN